MKIQKTKSLLPIEKIKRLMELEQQEREIKNKIAAYRTELLLLTQQLDVFTLKTGDYTLSRATRLTPQVTSFKTLKDSLEAAKIPYDVMEVFTPQTVSAFREVAKRGIELDGLDVMKTEYISIRIKAKGGKDVKFSTR